MTARATISFDEDNYSFLEKHAGKSRSAYINELLRRERQTTEKARIIAANEEEANDLAYQDELADWDNTLLDGLAGNE